MIQLMYSRVITSIALAAGVGYTATQFAAQYDAARGAGDSVSGVTAAVRPEQAQGKVKFQVAPTGNEARYRVNEQLVGVNLPGDAVGRTSKVTGAIVLGANNSILKEESSFTVDLTDISTDSDMRDNYVRGNTLETSQYPTIVFVPTAAEGLPASLPATGEINFKLTGDLKLHGTTKPVTWEVKAQVKSANEITGLATTAFKFSDFGMTIPRVRRVLSVEDNIRLEYEFRLVRGSDR